MDAATLLRSTRRSAGLTQRQLARRARTSAAAVSLCESGSRIPRVDTLERLLAAAGATLVIEVRGSGQPDFATQSQVLADRAADLVAVLDLADHLPQRHDAELEFPPFRSLVRR